jgi:D-alanyl-D-alanine carboxypeptidase (penicillin-binding protein 5/6)
VNASRCLLALCAGVLATLATVACWAAQAADDPFASVGQAYLVDIDGALVWQKNAHQRLPPASLTKLMTALLVVEQFAPEATITVDAAAAKETGTRLGLHTGERWRAQDLLAATLVDSANDACRALADQAGGDQPRFVQRMNQRAQEMGLRNTRFANACGHDAPGHYSSAADLRVLAQAVIQHAQLAALVAQADGSIHSLDGARSFTFANKNALIGRYAGAVGIKTGTTPLAGKCLVALVRRGPHTVLLVLLKGRDRWWDAVDVLDIAFARAASSAAP